MKNSVDKRKSKPLNKDTRAKYKAIVTFSESSAEHFKHQVDLYQEKINQCRIVIEHYEFVVDSIKFPGKGLLDLDQKTKEAIKDLWNSVEYNKEIIRKHKDMIPGSKNIIKLCKRQALMYERRVKEYRALLATTRTREKKVL
ncbi:hypothetical protein ES703_97241 [subsurface metagenome]